MNAVAALEATAAVKPAGALAPPEAAAALIMAQFRAYNDEFGRITRRAADHFLSGDAVARERDAVARIELYEQHVGLALRALRAAGATAAPGAAPGYWEAATAAYGALIERVADSDFYRTFYQFGDPRPVRHRGRQSARGILRHAQRPRLGLGADPGLPGCRTRCSRPSATCSPTCPSPPRSRPRNRQCDASVTELGRHFETRPPSAAPESIELIEPLFYRAGEAFLVGRLIGDSAVTPLVIAFRNGPGGVQVESVLLSRNEISSQFGYANSYFHVDLPVVGAAVTLLRSFMPRKPVDELYTVLGRAKQGKTERYFALRRHLDSSIDAFVHAPGERGLVMIVFTLPSHDLVFKVIRDRFGAPKHATRADVMERYRFVFRHDRAGRMVDAQEFRRLSLPLARFMPALAEELLREASQSCRLEGEELIVEHCYIERRLRPLNLFLREAEPAAAESAIVDYGNALRDLASTNIFAGDLLLKNFGVTRHGRVIFYDYDEVSLLGDCEFRELPIARTDEEESAAEPWFYVGPRDVFPEQWLPFLAMPAALREVFLAGHAELLTARWWRSRQQALADQAPAAANPA